MDREKLKNVIIFICDMVIVLLNVELFLCCLLIFRGIVTKQTEMVVFSLEMSVVFIFTLKFSNHFKNYFM